jgi:replicative DNA helicase
MSDLLTQIPPQDLTAESAVIGAGLLESDAARTAMGMLDPDDFYRIGNRVVMQAMALVMMDRQPLDLITLGHKLASMGELENIGGTLYLTTCMAGCPTTAGIRHYCHIVKECSMRRRAIKEASAMMVSAYATDAPLLESLAHHEQVIADIRLGMKQENTFTPLATLVKRAVWNQEQAILNGVSAGYKTGWRRFNHLIPPLCPGWLVLLAARPKVGKSSWALNFAQSLAQQGLPGLIFSLEMDEDSLTLRAMLSMMQGYAHKDLLDLKASADNPNIMVDFHNAACDLSPLPIDIDDRAGLKMRDIDDTIRQYARMKGENPKWVIVDFLQLCQPEKRTGTMSVDVGSLAYGLKELAKKHRLLMIALGQFNRKCEDQAVKRPALHHFEGSGQIEQAVDMALSLYRPGFYGDDELERAGYHPELHKNYTEVGIMASRHCEHGVCSVLDYDGAHYRFTEITDADYRSMFEYVNDHRKHAG